MVDPASDDAKLALKRFSLPPGLKASLWAAEPMLANPVAIDFDEKGRLFVSETYRYRTSVLDIRDYMGMLELDLASRTIEDRSALIHKVFGDQAKDFAIESEVVRLIEDTNHDGVADKSTIYADGFNSELDGIASGVLARHGKVWFTNIPSLWLLEGDPGHVKKTELLRGFGVRFNFTGHDFHGLALGNDGKLYFSIGDRGTHVPTKEGGLVDYPDEGAVYRANLDGTGLEIVHRGLRNPQELVFDEHGNLFTGDNDSDQGDQERLVYLVEGGDSGWRIGYQHAPLGKGGPWMSEGLWKPRFDGPAGLSTPAHLQYRGRSVGHHLLPGHRTHARVRGAFLHHAFQGQHRAQRHPDLHGAAERRHLRAHQQPAVHRRRAAHRRHLRPGRRAVFRRLGRWLAQVEQGPHLRHLAGEAGSGAGQDQRRSRQTTRGRLHQDASQAELVAPAFASGPSCPAGGAAGAGVPRRHHGRYLRQGGQQQVGQPAGASARRVGADGLGAQGSEIRTYKVSAVLADLLADKDAEVRAQAAQGRWAT